ncbi:MAG: decaprenyl-phosphate phosphoribosyltransferase [Actinobacteria bacterium]|nr:decaprenyl-phosphate phosphoribosyltransferase [Actinomycetota bacterium]MCA1719784.1 decaprenyl-phosphate phosphoribosyltransferase [Actinomycetota bacterium]
MSLTERAPELGERSNVLWGLVRAGRPKQWVKNVLVLAAPAAAGVLFNADVLVSALVAFVCFGLVSSGTYLLNDALDVHADRGHPRKRHRPIAAGIVPVPLAKAAAGALLVLGVALAALLSGWQLAVLLGAYVAIMQAYSLGLKREAVVELAIVSSGFVLRAIAGGIATDLPLSIWFLLVTSFGSLFIVTGKRHAERLTLGSDAGHHRAVLREYPDGFMQYVGGIAASVCITSYCLWSVLGQETAQPWSELSIAPFTLALLRYALLSARGEAGAPEEVFTRDRSLQVLGGLWLVVYGIGVHVGT